MDDHKPIRVRHFPSSDNWTKNIIYIRELIREEEKQGILIDAASSSKDDYLTIDFLEQPERSADILHFHWTDYQYRADTVLGTALTLFKYCVKLNQAKMRGYRIVWTMHNFLPHDSKHKFLNLLERLWMARVADAVIVHADCGRNLVYRHLGRKKNVHVIPHGNYIPFFDPPEYSQARKSLKIDPKKTVLLYFGYIRPYKGVFDLIKAFRSTPGEQLDLYIAGHAEENVKNELLKLCAGDDRIHPVIEYLTDEELATYLAASDVVVLPYRDILGSGALLTALSFGRPVIAPNIGAFGEFLDDTCGLVYPPGLVGLERALALAGSLNSQKLKQGAMEQAKAYAWDDMTRKIIAVYQDLLKDGHPPQ